MARKLIKFNGRWYTGRGHAYIAAPTKKRAVELARMCDGNGNFTMRELNEYWHTGAWGNDMENLCPNPDSEGVWVKINGQIERVL